LQSTGAGQPDSSKPGDGSARQERFARLERIFFEVAQLSPGDRDTAISRLCAGDAALESEARALVESAGRIGAFLEQPALGKGIEEIAQDTDSAAEDDLVGVTLGAFLIEKRLASGGMGTVYLAARSDGQFTQQVAIKVVKRGMDSEEVLRRFRAERQTLAALDHANIARLIDGGVTPDGRPFLVMEYVDGKPIDVYCDQRHLKIGERLRLFRDVCEAVHHAHKNLVIHRDLKPSNILVTESGIAKLLDFGIAKLISGDTAGATTEADRRLTPEYASPEQVEGRPVTTATDVYSLGVVLYELLTGSRPYYFSLRTNEEFRRIVCLLQPPAPSAAVTLRPSRLRGSSGPAPASGTARTPTEDAAAPGVDAPKTRGVSSTRLRSQLRGDLDNIVLMALRKEPQRRYASAEQLSADIGRFLGGMPVDARKDTLLYRASKFTRRHAFGVSLTIAALALLSASTVLLYRQGVELTRQRDEVASSNRRLEETRTFLLDVLSGGEIGNRGPDATLGTVIKDAARSLRDHPPQDALTRAASEQALGRATMSLGLLGEARTLLSNASNDYARAGIGTQPSTDLRTDLAELLFFEGKYAEAEAALRTLLADERSAFGGKHTAREGLLLNDLGSSLRAQGRVDEAISAQREAIGARSSALGAESLEVAESTNNLASALFQKGETAEAMKSFEAALEIRKKLLRPDHPLIVRAESNLGLVQLRAGDVDCAIALLTRSAEAFERAFGTDHPECVSTYTSLAQALRKKGRFDDSIAWLQRALDWQKVHTPQATEQIAATEANMGITFVDGGKQAQAQEILERVLPILRRPGGSLPGIRDRGIEALAKSYEATGKPEAAKALRESAKSN